MANMLTQRDLLELVEGKDQQLRCSLYLPLDSTGVDQNTKRLQLKHAITQLRAALSAREWREEKSGSLTEALQSLESHEAFLDRSSQGLAVLVPAANPERMKVYALDFRPDEMVQVSDRYAVAPLLQMARPQQPRLVLVLSENGLRMLRGTIDQLEAIPIPEGFPHDKDEVMRFELQSGLDPHDSTQHRSGHGGQRGATHGEGPKESVAEEFAKRYLREIGSSLASILKEKEKVLLVGVREQLASFRRLNPELPLLEIEIHGSLMAEPTESMRAKAIGALKEQAHEDTLKSLLATKELGVEWWSNHPEEISEAASQGRVHTLWVNPGISSLLELEELIFEVAKGGGEIEMVSTEHLTTPMLARFRWITS